jgi:hypothetical protein
MVLSPLWIFLLFQSASGGEIEVNAVVCQDASRSFLIAVLAFDVVAVILALILKAFWDKRLLWSQMLRLGVSLTLAILLSTALVTWNPMKDETLSACMESAEFSRYVLMSHVAALPRGLVLGGAISAGLFLVLALLSGLLSKRKSR